MKTVRTPPYQRKIRRMVSDAEAQEIERYLVRTCTLHPVIRGSGGMRKARIALEGRGKRGGGRIIYYVWQGGDTLFLMNVYAKNEQDDIGAAELKQLRELLDRLLED